MRCSARNRTALGIANVSKRRLRILWRTAKDKQKSTPDKNADTSAEGLRSDGTAKHSDIARRLVERISRVTRKMSSQWEFDDSKYARYEVILKAIFYVCFVAKSIEKGIIDLENLFVAGDGTKLETWSSPYGKKVCSCKDRCDCKRQFTDSDARWGYDSYRECYVYGHSKYEKPLRLSASLRELTAYSLNHSIQVPLVVRLQDCNRHDLIVGIASLREACEWLNFPSRCYW